jgi:hypothetical protein
LHKRFSSLSKYCKQKRTPLEIFKMAHVQGGWLLLFMVLAEWWIMTNSTYTKNNEDDLCSILCLTVGHTYLLWKLFATVLNTGYSKGCKMAVNSNTPTLGRGCRSNCQGWVTKINQMPHICPTSPPPGINIDKCFTKSLVFQCSSNKVYRKGTTEQGYKFPSEHHALETFFRACGVSLSLPYSIG